MGRRLAAMLPLELVAPSSGHPLIPLSVTSGHRLMWINMDNLNRRAKCSNILAVDMDEPQMASRLVIQQLGTDVISDSEASSTPSE